MAQIKFPPERVFWGVCVFPVKSPFQNTSPISQKQTKNWTFLLPPKHFKTPKFKKKHQQYASAFWVNILLHPKQTWHRFVDTKPLLEGVETLEVHVAVFRSCEVLGRVGGASQQMLKNVDSRHGRHSVSCGRIVIKFGYIPSKKQYFKPSSWIFILFCMIQREKFPFNRAWKINFTKYHYHYNSAIFITKHESVPLPFLHQASN